MALDLPFWGESDGQHRNAVLPDLYGPEEIAAAVLWLCSPGASYVVGEALTVGLDGVPDGYRVMNEREAIKVMVKP